MINLIFLQAAQFANRIERKFEGCEIFVKRDIQPRGMCKSTVECIGYVPKLSTGWVKMEQIGNI